MSKRSRFKRANPSAIELTERDVAIVRALEHYRFLTTDHLMALTRTASRQGITRRLRELFDAGYVDRPRAQMLTMAYAEKRPMVYALGNAGADLLADRFQLRLPDVYWTEKNRRVYFSNRDLETRFKQTVAIRRGPYTSTQDIRCYCILS